jgi:putative aldouronate transport system substrate-binding protein
MAIALALLALTAFGTISAAAAPAEITWYFIGNGPQGDVQAVQDAASKYIQSKGLNATIKLVCFDWGTYTDKLTQMIASGEPFDISFTASWANAFRPNATKGAFLPLNDPKGKYGDLLTKYAPKTKAALGADFLKGAAIDGINFAIPANKEKAHNWGFIVRSDLVKKYNFDLKKVKKLEDLEPLLAAIKKGEPDMYPLEAIVGESPRFLLDWDKLVDDKIPVSLYPDNRSTKVQFELDAPETMALFKTMHKFYAAGYVRKDAATVTDYNADEKAGLIFAATKSLKPGKDAEMTNSTGKPWVQVEITPPVMSNRETTGSLQAISRTSKDPVLAMKFLELFNTDPFLNNLINFGIEGKHYVFKDKAKGIIDKGPDVDKYNPGTAWMFGNQFINYLYANEDPAKWAKFLAYNKAALPLKDLGFSFDPSSVKSEVAACTSVWDEYIPSLETGTVDPVKAVPEAAAKFKAAGVDKIVAAAQKQYDAWLAGKK